MVLWIVGCATMADTVGTENMGKATGITTAAVSAGSLAGPMMAGILVETVGYWQAWSLSILVVGFSLGLGANLHLSQRYSSWSISLCDL